MPVRNLSGGGTSYRQKGGMTRNIRGATSSGEERQLSRKEEKAAAKEVHRRDKKVVSYLAEDENFPSFKFQLAKMGLQLRDIPADGNCLFRALGDQLEGHCRNHFLHRTQVVNFIRTHRLDFEPFVEDDISFDAHVQTLQKMGTHAGNDAIVAFARLHNVNVVIHQLNGKPLVIQGPMISDENTRQLHLAYHNGDHYSSVRRIDDHTESPALICIQDSDSSSGRYKKGRCDLNGAVVSARRGPEDLEAEVAIATDCMDVEKVRQTLAECDYDVDASIALLLQQLELTEGSSLDDSTLQSSNQTFAMDSGIWNMSGDCSCDSTVSAVADNSLHEGNPDVPDGMTMMFPESRVLDRSGCEAVSATGARPKVIPVQQKKLKENKKLEKKKRAEDRRREKILGGGLNQHIPTADDRKNVTVVSSHCGQLTRI